MIKDQKKQILLCANILLILLMFVSVLPIAEPQELENTDITFQPNVIPYLNITFVEEFFRFKWFENRFDLKLLINYSGSKNLLSLRDFWEKTNRVMNWENISNRATESMYEFGYNITDIPEEIADNIEYLIWKIEGASFDISEIELEVIEDPELYNITRIHLPDNLVLSYEDLWLYNFTVSHPNKLETKVEGVKGKTNWNLDPITFSGDIITAIGGTAGSPLDFEDLWDADKAGNLTLVDRDGITGTDGSPISNTIDLRPTDEVLMSGEKDDLWILIENWSGLTSAWIRVMGTNEADNYEADDVFVNGNGVVNLLGDLYKTCNRTQVITFTGSGSFDYSLVQGQWGVVWKTVDTQYTFDSRIVFGNGTSAGTTYFNDTAKQVTFTSSAISANWQLLMEPKLYGFLQFGTLEDETTKRTSRGVSFISLTDYSIYFTRVLYDSSAPYDNQFYAYSCNFINEGAGQMVVVEAYRGQVRVWNGLLSRQAFLKASGGAYGSKDFYNVIMEKGTASQAALTLSTTIASLDKLLVTDIGRIMYFSGTSEFSINELYARGYTYLARPVSWTGTGYIINADVDSWAFGWYLSSGEIYRQYEFDLNVTDSSGSPIQNANVTVRHYGQAETQDFSFLTGSNGSFATQTLSMGFYNQTGGNSLYSYNDYNITITHGSYATKTFNFTLEQKIEWVITLEEPAGKSWAFSFFFITFMILVVCAGIIIVAFKK